MPYNILFDSIISISPILKVELVEVRGKAMQISSDLTPSGMVTLSGLGEVEVTAVCDRLTLSTGHRLTIANKLGTAQFTVIGAREIVSMVASAVKRRPASSPSRGASGKWRDTRAGPCTLCVWSLSHPPDDTHTWSA